MYEGNYLRLTHLVTFTKSLISIFDLRLKSNKLKWFRGAIYWSTQMFLTLMRNTRMVQLMMLLLICMKSMRVVHNCWVWAHMWLQQGKNRWGRYSRQLMKFIFFSLCWNPFTFSHRYPKRIRRHVIIYSRICATVGHGKSGGAG